MKIYQVGGAVRDRLMGKTPHDYDHVVIGSNIDEMLSSGFTQVGKSFPVFINKSTGNEYALARKEIKTGPKHTDFEFIFDSSVTLKDDLKRRDFTCNALAFDEENQTVIDYHNGIQDIHNKILRHIDSDHFIEDPLRVLRMCRFAAQLNFTIADDTMALASQMVRQNMLKYLSSERIWQEIFKAMQTPDFDKFIFSARQCGALKQILPEVEQLFFVPENPHTHPEKTVGNHTILGLQYLKNASPEEKFAFMMHDIGKIKTPLDILPHHPKHDTEGIAIINTICQRLKIPTKFKKLAILCCRYHSMFWNIENLSLAEMVTLGDQFKKALPKQFIEVCRADYFGRQISLSPEKQQIKENLLLNIIKILKTFKLPDTFGFDDSNSDISQIICQKKISLLQQNLKIPDKKS